MKQFGLTISAVALVFFANSCIDKNYDLNKLDPTITILPGIEVPVENGDIVNSSLDEFLDINGTKNSSDGTLLIDASASTTQVKSVDAATIQNGGPVKIDGELVTYLPKNNSFLNIEGIGKVLDEPSLVIAFTNPSNYPMNLSADITDGAVTKTISARIPASGTYNFYVSELGNASSLQNDNNAIKASCKGFDEFFSKDIPDKLTVKNITLQGDAVKSSSVATRAGESYTFKTYAFALIGLRFKSKAEFIYNTTVSFPSEIDPTEYNFKKGDELVLNADVEMKDIAFDFTPSVTNGRGKIDAVMDPATIEGAKGSQKATITITFLDTPQKLDEADVSIKITNPKSEAVTIKGTELFKITVASITSTNGITL